MMVMDVGRVLSRQPKAIEPRLDDIRPATEKYPLLRNALSEIEDLITTPEETTRI